jgi:hypothetical protein
MAIETQHSEDQNQANMPVAYAISRPEDFILPQNNNEDGVLNHLTSHLNNTWENFPKALVISEGGFNNSTIGRPTLAELVVVSSTINLKMKYYTVDKTQLLFFLLKLTQYDVLKSIQRNDNLTIPLDVNLLNRF